jgi:pimeloyl-ACP methyl ester carboxylesterase
MHLRKDISLRREEIRVPTSVMYGRDDEATPRMAETMQRGIPGAELVIFGKSAHFPHIEEAERFMEVLTDFLDRVEASR